VSVAPTPRFRRSEEEVPAVVLQGGKLVSSPFYYVVLAGGECPAVSCSFPLWGYFNEIQLLVILLLFIVLVVCLLESPGELLASTGSLPLPQSLKLKKELENKKPQIPENGKTNQKNKRKKKANKMPL
jgi:hypothetical protein